MFTDILMGTVGVLGTAAGVSALVLYRKNGNGHSTSPSSPSEPAVELDEKTAKLVKTLDEVPRRIENSFQWLVQAMTAITDQYTKAPPPVWTCEITERLDEVIKDLRECAAHPLVMAPPPWPPGLAETLDRITDRVEALLQMGPAPSAAVAELALAELDKLAIPLTQLPADLQRGFEGLGHQLGEILAAERNRIAKSSPPPGNVKTSPPSGGGGEAGGGGSPPAPPRQAPPANAPRIPAGAQPVTPQIPAPYVGGSVYVPAGEVTNLLVLIQYGLSPNCPGSSAEFSLAADDGPIFVGAASALGGPLSAQNYAYQLTGETPPRIYRSTYPGNNTPIGELQVLAPSGGFLHVEVQT
jgi:hypothetical protein